MAVRRFISVAAQKLNQSLAEADPEFVRILELEKVRQRNSVVLIASENFTSSAVLEALGSVMTNKYSEGYPGARYYGGNEFIDMAENLCRDRALKTFRLDPASWGVNVQPLSGSPCNFYVYTAILGPHERMMALDLPHGGHLSHGFRTDLRKVSATSIYFESLPYRLDEATGLIDYEKLHANAKLFRPKLIVGGFSAYSRDYDYEKMRQICDDVGAVFMYDMAHTSGLVAADVGLKDPFKYADIVTTTTHKSLRGPRGAMIFYRKGFKKDKKGQDVALDYEAKIDSAVFPGHQGGPHNHTISALAVALKLAMQDEFKVYQRQVLKNAKSFASDLQGLGFNIVTGGTDNHLMLVDLRNQGIDGAKLEKTLEAVNIASNKNTIPSDKSALTPSGIRFGTPAMTSRGLVEKDFEVVAKLVKEAADIAKEVKAVNPNAKIGEFVKGLAGNKRVEQVRKEVEDFASKFPTIGF